MQNCELHALEHKRYRNVHGHDCVGSGFYTGLIDSPGKEGCWTPGDYTPAGGSSTPGAFRGQGALPKSHIGTQTWYSQVRLG